MSNYNTPYDDSFRTLLTDCPRMIIPVINEMFGRDYGIGEKVTLYQNEHYAVSGADEERITDSNISVGEDTQTRYDIECQSSPDSTMAVRIFEYATQVAKENSTLEDGRWVFRFPKSGILYLRDPGKSDVFTIEVQTPGGTVSYTVPVIKMSGYGLEDIFGKRLWFLLPFYFFRYRPDKMEKDETLIDEMKQEYREILARMDGLVENGVLTDYEKATVKAMMEKVALALSEKYAGVTKGVEDIMGGKVLDYEAKRILNAGLERGRTRERIDAIRKMINKNYDMEEILDLGYSEEEYNEAEASLMQTV